MAGGPYLRLARPRPEPVRLTSADLCPDLDATYRAMAELTGRDPQRWGAWKLGGTNAGSRAAFKVDRLYYGAIARDEILETADAAPGVELAEIKGEAEIALRVAADGRSWDAWAVSLEMPASPIADLVELGVRALVADRCAAGSLVLGPIQSGPLPKPTASVTQSVNGAITAKGQVADLTDRPQALFAEFLDMAALHGAPVAPGHWVATGGITPCIPYREGDEIVVALDGEPHVSMTISTGG